MKLVDLDLNEPPPLDTFGKIRGIPSTGDAGSSPVRDRYDPMA
jgi:hypothetical protein